MKFYLVFPNEYFHKRQHKQAFTTLDDIKLYVKLFYCDLFQYFVCDEDGAILFIINSKKSGHC